MATLATLGGKSIARIRREPIDRMFIGTHSQKIQGRETWYEMTHMIKGATFAATHVIEKNGDGGDQGGAGFLISMTAEPAQNNWADYEFYLGILNGFRNVIIVTGTGERKLLRAFRLNYQGAGVWGDNRVSIVTDDTYNSSMDKAAMKISGWVSTYEIYTIGTITLTKNSLAFKILEGAPGETVVTPGL